MNEPRRIDGTLSTKCKIVKPRLRPCYTAAMVLAFFVVLLFATLIALVFAINTLWQTLRTGLPYVSTPRWAIAWLQNNLPLQPSDVLYELGCGDARVLTALATSFPDTKCIGIEIQWWPYLLAKWRTRQLRNVTILRADLYRQDLSAATLVYGFFITNFVPKLRHTLRNKLRAGTRVISFGFALPDWPLEQRVENPKRPGGSALLLYRA